MYRRCDVGGLARFDAFEARRRVGAALEAAGWSFVEAARELNVSARHLRRLAARLGLRKKTLDAGAGPGVTSNQ